jgi:predicted ATPase
LSRAAARAFTTQLLQWLGSDGARALATETIGIAESEGLPFFHAWAEISLGWDLISGGEFELGREKLASAIDAWLRSGSELMVPYFRCVLAEAHSLAGECEIGLAQAADAIEMAERNGDRLMLSEMHRLAGRVLERAQRLADAEQRYELAICIARRQHAKSLELRAATDLARLWARRDEPMRAAGLLGPLCASFVEGLSNQDLVDARSLMARCASQPYSLNPSAPGQ